VKLHDQVADAFGSTAAACLTSVVHATGADLQELARIHFLWKNAPDEVRQYFAVHDDGSFELDALMAEAVIKMILRGTRQRSPSPYEKTACQMSGG
jgi:hypothetical protein